MLGVREENIFQRFAPEISTVNNKLNYFPIKKEILSIVK